MHICLEKIKKIALESIMSMWKKITEKGGQSVINNGGIITHHQTGGLNIVGTLNINNNRRDLSGHAFQKATSALSHGINRDTIIDIQFDANNDKFASQWASSLISAGWQVHQQTQVLSYIPEGIFIVSKNGPTPATSVLEAAFRSAGFDVKMGINESIEEGHVLLSFGPN